tara:strand:- start:111 stop:353 length:243 start_codon:yes stop_codon:yes gene_type:complete
MTQQQAQKELQDIEKIAEAILRGDKYFDGSRISCDKSKTLFIDYPNLHGMELPRGQRCGTHYQQRSYALIKARELFNQNK